MESTLVQLSLKNQSILVINCNVKHELTGSEYPTRRQNCADAAAILNVKSLRYADMSMLDSHKAVGICWLLMG